MEGWGSVATQLPDTPALVLVIARRIKYVFSQYLLDFSKTLRGKHRWFHLELQGLTARGATLSERETTRPVVQFARSLVGRLKFTGDGRPSWRQGGSSGDATVHRFHYSCLQQATILKNKMGVDCLLESRLFSLASDWFSPVTHENQHPRPTRASSTSIRDGPHTLIELSALCCRPRRRPCFVKNFERG